MSPTLRPPAAHTPARRSSLRLDRTDLHQLKYPSTFYHVLSACNQTPCLGSSVRDFHSLAKCLFRRHQGTAKS